MNKPIDSEFDVVVIGGGVSGFTSAFTITQKDPCLNVVILEESSKIGGNVLSDAHTIEFVSNSNQYLKYILRKLNLAPSRRISSGTAISELAPGKITYSDDEIPMFASYVQRKKFEYFLSKIEILCEQISLNSPMASLESKDLDSISMEDYICKNISSEGSRNYMRTIVQTNCGVQAKDMSALFYIAYCHSTGGIKNQLDRSLNGSTGYFFENACEVICKSFQQLEKFKVNLNEGVKAIWRDYSSISVITDKKRYKCLHVVVALSPDKVLLLDIKPSLVPTRITVLNEMCYNLVETTVINHVVPGHLSGDVICAVEKDNSIQRSIDIQNLRPNSLFVFLYCNDLDKMQKQLNRYFGESAEDEIMNDCKVEDYHDYKICSVPALKTLKDFHEIRRPMYRLFWAGTHTSTVWYGHLEGSVYTGMRAGIELLYDYKPQVLSRHDIIFLTNKSSPVSVFKEGKVNKLVRHRKYYTSIMCFAALIITLGIYKRLKK